VKNCVELGQILLETPQNAGYSHLEMVRVLPLEPFWKSLISKVLPEKGREKTGKSQQKVGFCVALQKFGVTRIQPARCSLTG
jgi:hypothetical protein